MKQKKQHPQSNKKRNKKGKGKIPHQNNSHYQKKHHQKGQRKQ